LGKSIPGIERLKSAWAKHEADIPVEWRTLIVDEFEAALPANAIVVVTDASFLSGAVEDIRRDERLVAAVRHLASRVQTAGGRLILQASEHHATLLETCVTSDGYRAYQQRERALRESFGYPPAVRLVKILVDGTEHEARRWMETAGASVKTADGELRGPYAVAYRPRSRKARWVVHAVFPKRVEHKRLLSVFRPLVKDVIIDLDPIAFFR
jgi:primosomal protein N'